MRVFLRGKKPEDDLFDRINASKLNDYLKEMMEDLSAKVFRTYNASITLQQELGKFLEYKKANKDIDKSVEGKVTFYNDANRQVAILCNHQKSVSKTHDATVEKMVEKLNEKKEKLKKLETHQKGFKQKGNQYTSKDKDQPKTLEQTVAKINKLKTSIATDEFRIKNKEDNKTIALGTSKINYMDPRISVAWCKNHEVPIEKVFPKTLRSKFVWAMFAEPEYEF